MAVYFRVAALNEKFSKNFWVKYFLEKLRTEKFSKNFPEIFSRNFPRISRTEKISRDFKLSLLIIKRDKFIHILIRIIYKYIYTYMYTYIAYKIKRIDRANGVANWRKGSALLLTAPSFNWQPKAGLLKRREDIVRLKCTNKV